MGKNSKSRINIYSFQIQEEGGDVIDVLSVAAPDARKALATVEKSTAKAFDVLMMAKAHGNVPQVSIPDGALIWEPGHGQVVSSRKSSKTYAYG